MRSRRVLVMDDDHMVLHAVASLLECLGYQVITCTNGEDAVELYRQSLDRHLPILTAILDLQIEDGMGGIEAAKAILEIDPEAELVVSSGYSEYDPLCKELFKHSLPKPYTIAELENVLAAINTYFRTRHEQSLA